MGGVRWIPREGEEGNARSPVEKDSSGDEGSGGEGDEAEGEGIGGGFAGEA